jgi:hypothetical protein
VTAPWRVDRGDGDFDDRHARAKRGEDDLRFEAEALVVGLHGEGALDGVAAKAALRVAKAPPGEHGDEEVRDVVADQVAARRAGAREIAHPEDERAGIVAAGKKARRLLRRVLAVGVDGDGDVASGFLRRAQTRADGGPFAEVLRVRQHRGAGRFGDAARSVPRTVVHDEDGDVGPELGAHPLDDGADRGGGVEGRNEDGGAHGPSF